MHNHAITIANTTIHQDAHGRYCLNDLHRAAGSHNRQRPSFWLKSQQTKELIEEISKAGIPAIQSKQQLGTFACKELVYCYAMWISPMFHLKVIQAYDTLVTGNLARPEPQTLALATQVGQLTDMVKALTEALHAQNQRFIGLQGQMIGSQKGHIRSLNVISQMQKRHEAEDIRRTIIYMKARGDSNAEIMRVTGKCLNYIRQRVFIARRDGVLPAIPVAPVAQGELNLGGVA